MSGRFTKSTLAFGYRLVAIHPSVNRFANDSFWEMSQGVQHREAKAVLAQPIATQHLVTAMPAEKDRCPVPRVFYEEPRG
jgi:hypothetical protein